MTDTTSAPAATGHDNAHRVGEQLGLNVAGIVILNMRAAERGWEDGCLFEHATTHPVTYAIPDPDAVPERFTRMPVHTQTYRDQFTEGRADYRADNPRPASVPATVATA